MVLTSNIATVRIQMGIPICFTIIYGTIFGSMTVQMKKGNEFYHDVIETEKCQQVEMPENDIKTLKEIFRNFKSILNTYLKEEKSIEKVVSEFDPFVPRQLKTSLAEVNISTHQLVLYKEMKEILTEMKNLSYSFYGKGDSMFNSGGNELLEELNIYKPTASKLGPSDCSEILVAGYKKSGVYEIYPFSCHCTRPVKVYCDMDTEGGGWTVFLSRLNSSKPVNFTRNWQDYKNGFGDAENEYWLGLETLHILTASRNYMLRLDANNKKNKKIWGEWSSFSVNSEDDKYRLLVGTQIPRSESVDLFKFNNNAFFSTFDFSTFDNAKKDDKCTSLGGGGWWYGNCTRINPTGIYGKDGNETWDGILLQPWSLFYNVNDVAKWLQLKIRPKICNDKISTVHFNTHNCAFNG